MQNYMKKAYEFFIELVNKDIPRDPRYREIYELNKVDATKIVTPMAAQPCNTYTNS